MKKYKEVVEKVQEIDTIICDICGEDITSNIEYCETSYSMILRENSHYPGGGIEDTTIDLCKECYHNNLTAFEAFIKVQLKL